MRNKPLQVHIKRLQLRLFNESGRSSYDNSSTAEKTEKLTKIIDKYLHYYSVVGKDKNTVLAALRPFVVHLFNGEEGVRH